MQASVWQRLQGGVIASVQASQGEPLDRSDILVAMALSAVSGGACGVRMAQPDNVQAFRQAAPDVPLVGITKPPIIPPDAHAHVYITPTGADIDRIAPWCDMVAMDATDRPCPGSEPLAERVAYARGRYPHLLLMADVSTVAEGRQAVALGMDVISTTLSGYTTATLARQAVGPDFELLSALTAAVSCPVVMEGRLWEPAQVQEAFARGAFAVVIGSAVSRPHEITRRFVAAAPPRVQG